MQMAFVCVCSPVCKYIFTFAFGKRYGGICTQMLQYRLACRLAAQLCFAKCTQSRRRCKLLPRSKYDFNVDIQNCMQLYPCYGAWYGRLGSMDRNVR